MNFKILPVNTDVRLESNNTVYLITDNWNDWFEFRVLYQMYYKNELDEISYIGPVKFGEVGMLDGQATVNLPNNFDSLSSDFFSMGIETSYYENLNQLGDEFRDEFLKSLNDVSLNLEVFEKVKNERVTTKAIMRDITSRTIKEKFHPLAKGDSTLSNYKFNYIIPKPGQYSEKKYEIAFEVNPNSSPPSNIHTIIGRNGVGKTFLLNEMIKTLISDEKSDEDGYMFNQPDVFFENERIFDNVVYISFSPFDESKFLEDIKGSKIKLGYTYIGLRKSYLKKEGFYSKSSESLRYELMKSMWKLRDVANKLPSKKERFKQSINMLNNDLVFNSSGVQELLTYSEEEINVMENSRNSKKRIPNSVLQKLEEDFNERAYPLCKKFSSGHSIVLLTISKLVENLKERTLVLLDEPETHLHPPLLSNFMRILSYLLIKQNGVGIIATHSPVVLQEIPKECVWIYNRIGSELDFIRPEIETFGENINILTKEAFSFEVTDSGFHKLLKNVANNFEEYEKALNYFDGKLGMEARAILRVLVTSKGNKS